MKYLGILLLLACATPPGRNNDPVEKAYGEVLEKHATTTHDGLDGTKYWCFLVVQLPEKRVRTTNRYYDLVLGMYDACMDVVVGDSVEIIRRSIYDDSIKGWWLTTAIK